MLPTHAALQAQRKPATISALYFLNTFLSVCALLCVRVDSKTFRLAFDANSVSAPVAASRRNVSFARREGSALRRRRHWVDVCGCDALAATAAAAAFVYLFAAVPFSQRSASAVGQSVGLSPRHIIFSALRVPDLNATQRRRRRRHYHPLSLLGSSNQHERTTHEARESVPSERTNARHTGFLLDFIVAVFVVAVAELRTT